MCMKRSVEDCSSNMKAERVLSIVRFKYPIMEGNVFSVVTGLHEVNGSLQSADSSVNRIPVDGDKRV